MTVVITITIIETFWSLPVDIRVFIGFGAVAVLFLVLAVMLGVRLDNPFYVGGLLFLGISVISLLHYTFIEITPTVVDVLRNATNFEFPIAIVVK